MSMLLPAVARAAERISALGPLDGGEYESAGVALADWIRSRLANGRPAPVIFVCTGNSRRSVLGAVLGNVAAGWYQLPGVRCYSGGTAPSALNRRTIATLCALGIEIEPTGEQAPRGAEGIENPIYRIRWGADAGESTGQMLDFSKHYGTTPNPREGFAAVMVCDEADAGCPNVAGAAIRIPAKFVDPKVADDTAEEQATYAARRDQIGRFVFGAMERAAHSTSARP
ncbi:MAG: protein-tyrosine-phosphatase [Planctomycetota bacterium]|nr:protein-tyrosine-phosphatase [Planctomycetota bacterium]